MSEKILVPEGMLAWVIRARYGTANEALTEQIRRDLEAALRWLLERNRLPLPSIADDRYQGPEWATGWNCGTDAVRRMFLAPEPEPEVPEEIKNLLIPIRNLDEAHGPCGKTALEFNCAVLETARRIRESR